MTADRLRAWALACLALLACASPALGAPVIRFTDTAAAPTTGGPDSLGLPIAIFGHGFGSERGASRVTIAGREVASYRAWGPSTANPGLDVIVVQPGPRTRAGRIAVRVGAVTAIGPRFAPTGGRIFVVAPGGADAAACTLRAPCATIQHAIDERVRPGDAVLVRGGPVNDDEVWVRASAGGTNGRPVVIRAFPGERPTFPKSSRPVILEGSHVAVSGFDLPGGKSIVAGGVASRDIRVTDSRFTGEIGFDSVGTHGDDILVAGNSCVVSGSTVGTQGHCYYISHGHRVRILDNIARGATGYGIHIFDQQRSADDFRREITDVVVDGNVLEASRERSGLIVAMGDEGGRGNRIARVTIRGNTFAGNNFAGVTVGANVQSVRVVANTFRGNGRQGLTVADEPTIRGVVVTGNRFEQAPNGACTTNCEWYPRMHIQSGLRARGVVVRGNRYSPFPPLLLGTSDSRARPG